MACLASGSQVFGEVLLVPVQNFSQSFFWLWLCRESLISLISTFCVYCLLDENLLRLQKIFGFFSLISPLVRWVCICWSTSLLSANKSLRSTVISPRVSSTLFTSVCEFILLRRSSEGLRTFLRTLSGWVPLHYRLHFVLKTHGLISWPISP